MVNAMHDTQSERVQGQLPCDKCNSSDAMSLYDDGHTFCFSCKNRENSETKEFKAPAHKSSELISGSYEAIEARGISRETCQKWGVERVTTKDGKPALSFPYYNLKGQKVAQKLRGTSKDFTFLGDTKNPMMFGQQLWSKGRKIIITEGELDAMSISQVQNHKWPVVSIPNGAQSAKKSITQNLRWLEENFEEIVLMFDMDEPGQEAAIEVAQLFSPGKCGIAALPCKDANDCLVQGKVAELTNAVWNPKPYRPDGIVTVADVLPKLDEKPTFGLSLPWSQLTELTYGIKSPAVWVWTSGSGMGKTEFFKDMAAHLITEHKTKVGMILLEEETQDTVVDMAGKMVGKCFNSPDVKYNEEERQDAVNKLNESDCLYLYDHFGHDDYDAIRSVIRHMVLGYGCRVIFLDHITAFTDGLGNEANALAEKMMKELSSMARELKFNLQVISHVRKSDSSRTPAEEGGRVKIDDLKGSGAIKQWSNFIIGLERNQQATDEEESRTTTVRILKARGVGKNVGRTVKVLYQPETATLVQADEAFMEDLPF